MIEAHIAQQVDRLTKLELNYVIVDLSGGFANVRHFLFCLQRASKESLHCFDTLNNLKPQLCFKNEKHCREIFYSYTEAEKYDKLLVEIISLL